MEWGIASDDDKCHPIKGKLALSLMSFDVYTLRIRICPVIYRDSNKFSSLVAIPLNHTLLAIQNRKSSHIPKKNGCTAYELLVHITMMYRRSSYG